MKMEKDVSLTYEGGWKILFDIRNSMQTSNVLRVVEIILLLLILSKIK